MKTKLLFNAPVTTLITLFCILSCTNSSVDISPLESTNTLAKGSIKSTNGILTFQNMEEFYQTVSKWNKLTLKERIALDKKYNFQSYRNLFEQSKYADLNASLTTQENNQLSIHPFCKPLSVVLNKDGLVLVEGTLVGFSNNIVKSISLNDYATLNEACSKLLAEEPASSSNKISVSKVEKLTPFKNVKNARISPGVYSIFGPVIRSITFATTDDYQLEGKVEFYAFDMITVRVVQITAKAVTHMTSYNGFGMTIYSGGDDECQQLGIGANLTTNFAGYIGNSSIVYNPGYQHSYLVYIGTFSLPSTLEPTIEGNVNFGATFRTGATSSVQLQL